MINKLSAERKELQALNKLPHWYTTQAWQLWKANYQHPDEELGVEHRFKTIAKTLVTHLPEDLKYDYYFKFFKLLWEGYVSLSTPALKNIGKTTGLPVACSGQSIGDSVFSFYDSLKEAAVLSKNGFGTSANFTGIRPKGADISTGGKANGVLPVLDSFMKMAQDISQGGTRRGAFAGYIDIEHADAMDICKEVYTYTDEYNIGWVINDSFVKRLKAKDPEALERYREVLHLKLTRGKGYFFFKDKVNRRLPEAYINNNLEVNMSNLCTEITLFNDEEHTFTCILASLNLEHWDTLKDNPTYIEDALVMLDCICSEFLVKAKDIKGLEKAIKFTEKSRALGLGTVGLNTYFHSKMLPFTSSEAQDLNVSIFRTIQIHALRASRMLAKLLGEPEWCKGTGMRNTHVMAQAPTKSTSLLMGGLSEGIAPYLGMVFEANSAGGSVSRIPKYFLKFLKEKGHYDEGTLASITSNLGSVQHLTWMTEKEKLVFRNAFEINQMELLDMASARQPYIDQAQSINLFIPLINTDNRGEVEKLFSSLMTRAISDENILSLYYTQSRNGAIINNECLPCSA